MDCFCLVRRGGPPAWRRGLWISFIFLIQDFHVPQMWHLDMRVFSFLEQCWYVLVINTYCYLFNCLIYAYILIVRHAYIDTHTHNMDLYIYNYTYAIYIYILLTSLQGTKGVSSQTGCSLPFRPFRQWNSSDWALR